MTFSLREALPQDAPFIQRLFRMPHVQAFLNAPDREMILATLEEPDAENYVIETGGQPIGNFILRDRGFLVDFGSLAVSQPGMGAGTFALRWGLRRAFLELRAHRVFLEIREDNIGSRRLCERLGFVQEGLYRDGFLDERTGEFHNLCPYAILVHEFEV